MDNYSSTSVYFLLTFYSYITHLNSSCINFINRLTAVDTNMHKSEGPSQKKIIKNQQLKKIPEKYVKA